MDLGSQGLTAPRSTQATRGTAIHKEPPITVGSLGDLASAIIALVVGFGAPVTKPQRSGIVAVVGSLVAVFVAGRHVTPRRRKIVPVRRPTPPYGGVELPFVPG